MTPIIVHDLRRAARLPELTSRLGSEVVSVAGSGVSPWAGMVGAIGAGFASGDPHLLIVEDDAEPCAGFVAAVEAACKARPHDALFFFATEDQAGAEIRLARTGGSSWALVREKPVGSLAVALPLGLAIRFLSYFGAANDAEFCRRFPASIGAGDTRLWWFLTRVCGQALCVSAWSLVGHGCPSDAETLTQVGHHAPRHAFRPVRGVFGASIFGEEPVDAATIDWSAGSQIDSRIGD